MLFEMLAVLAVADLQVRYEIKGIAIGDSQEKVESTWSAKCDSRKSPIECSANSTFAQSESLLVADIIDGKVCGASASGSYLDFLTYSKALTEKYGEPWGSSDTSVIWKSGEHGLAVMRMGRTAFAYLTETECASKIEESRLKHQSSDL